MNPNPKPDCPWHKDVAQDLREIKERQADRPCRANEVRIATLEKSDDEQWAAINQLRKSVWFGAGAAFAGSGVASLLFQYLFRGH